MKTFRQFLYESQSSAERQAYFDKIYRQAKSSGDKFPELVAAQAALESGWGSSPSGKNNYFGQKASGNEPATVRRTREVYGGKDTMIDAPFKDYDSPNASVNDRINKWSYKYGDAKDVETAASRLQLPGGTKIPGSKEISHGAYATDPNYVSTVSRIARDYRAGVKDNDSVAPTSSPKVTPPKTFTKTAIADKGGKGGTVSTNTAYKTKLGGRQATSTRGETGTQVIRTNLGNQGKKANPKQIGKSFSATLGGQKGTVKIGKEGQRTFTAIKPAPKPK